ncbi:dynamin family protein [Helicobacter pylori]
MNAQELIQKNALVEKVIKEQGLQEKAGPFISENAVIKTEELEKTLKGMQAENRGLKVGIIGRVKAGKSSLLNALIFEGKDVLPKATTPMTASLTILKYAQNLSAETQFYNEKDMEELKRDHERYEKKFKEIVSEEVKKIEEKQQGLLNKAKEKLSNFSKSLSRNKSNEEVPKERILSDEEILKKAQKIAKKELDEDAKLTASYDQYERMKKSGLINPKDLETRIQSDSLEELNQKLYQFVGKEGKFMPYTKAVQISLNNPNLKSLEIIDTPGVNDPIVSREERTKALLKDCDVVFVIIPSGNFLTDSDMDLFDRVSNNKEGIQRVYFVASQADSAVCTPSEVENSRHHLPTALTNTQKILSSSLNATMSLLKKKYPHQQEIFESAIKNGVILTSGVCYNLYKDFENQASWEREKEEYQLAWENLTNDYPDAFSSHEARENLKRLSNIDAIRERLEEVAKEKENIISQRLQEYLKSQANNFSSLVANLLRELESEKNRIKDADLNKISEQLKEYEKLSDKIEINFKEEYDTFVLNFIKDIKNRLNNALKEAAQTASDGIKEKEENPERVEQDGFLGGFKRLWGGVFGEDWGYESGIKAGAVIDFLKEMNKDCEDALNDQVKSFKIDFKKNSTLKEETNRREREFEEIKKIVSECRDYNKLYIENSGLSFEELQGHRDEVNYFNELLQSEFSMKNLLTLRQFKDTYREWYSKLRQLNEAKEVVSELRDYWLQELPPSAKDLISYCDTLLKLDYSLENLQKLRRFKDNFKKDYQKCKRSR